jgi:hypothetical protein
MRLTTALLSLLLILCVGGPIEGWAADRVGNWEGKYQFGTADGSSSYVKFHGAHQEIAILRPFVDEVFTWATDSASGYSGEYEVSRWFSDQGTVTWAMVDSVNAADLWVQGSYDNGTTWYRLKQLSDSAGTSTIGEIIIDTLDFTDPILSVPTIRLEWVLSDPQDTTAMLDYAIIKLIKP